MHVDFQLEDSITSPRTQLKMERERNHFQSFSASSAVNPDIVPFKRETLCSFSENELLFWREMKVNFCHYVLSSEALKVHSSAPCFRWRRPRPKLVGVR